MVAVKLKDQSHNLIPDPIPEIDMSFKENSYEDTDANELESSISVADSSEERAWVSSFLKPRKVLHKRKGIPHRAPLC